MAEENKKSLNHEMFTNKDGYVEGGKEIEMTNPAETQEQEVQGQGKILKENVNKHDKTKYQAILSTGASKQMAWLYGKLSWWLRLGPRGYLFNKTPA